MIEIRKSATADSRTCDVSQVSKETLLASSRQHIGDVVKAMAFFSGKLIQAAGEHDYDKLTAIDWFFSDFRTKFEEHGWWDNHRKIHRHHLGQADGVPEDVNLLDVLEYIADCVMAGMARAGDVYPLEMSDELIQRAFRNTVALMKSQVVVIADAPEGSLPPHQQRVIDEKCQLDTRLQALRKFIEGNATFSDLPVDERRRMRQQMDAMVQYSCILAERIESFPE